MPAISKFGFDSLISEEAIDAITASSIILNRQMDM